MKTGTAMNSTKIMVGMLTALYLQGCEKADPVPALLETVVDAEIQHFIKGIKNNLIFVEGGEFLMGDFGLQQAPEFLPYDRDKDSKPPHKVELSSYSINKFKITNADYQLYLKLNDLILRDNVAGSKENWNSISALPNTPAHVDWYEAKQYCTWLASVTELPFALPTEAQWEYAARSRGQLLFIATDDGTYKGEPYDLITESYTPKGINISSDGDRLEFAKKMGWKTGRFTPLPVDMFPPNPLGLYSMSDNGHEWVNDWYDPDYYKYSPVKDPQGPDKPTFKDPAGHFTKVIRGQGYANPYWGGGVNIFRTAQEPLGRFAKEGLIHLSDKTARCVVNSPAPVQAP